MSKHKNVYPLLACLLVATVLTSLPIQSSRAEESRVHINNARVHPKKDDLSPAMMKLRIHTKVQVIERGKRWTKIKTPPPSPNIGYVRTASLEPKKKGLIGGSGSTSDRETAMASRGYNPEVEGQYKKDNPNLQAAFVKLDQIIADPINQVSGPEARAFLDAGGVKQR